MGGPGPKPCLVEPASTDAAECADAAEEQATEKEALAAIFADDYTGARPPDVKCERSHTRGNFAPRGRALLPQ
jgi:hypothetical protein